MAADLVSILVRQAITEPRPAGDGVVMREVSAALLQVHLMGRREHPQLGMIHLRLECQPKMVPDMTREETRTWLREQLVALLTADD